MPTSRSESKRRGGLNRSYKALRTSAVSALIHVVYEARLVQLGAGKAHLGVAFHALRDFVETLGLVLYHAPTASLAAGSGCTVPQLQSRGNQPEFLAHTLDVLNIRGRPHCSAIGSSKAHRQP